MTEQNEFRQEWEEIDFWADPTPMPEYLDPSEPQDDQNELLNNIHNILEPFPDHITTTDPTIQEQLIEAPQMIESRDNGSESQQEVVRRKRQDNTIDRPIITAIRNAIKSECQGADVAKKQLSRIKYNRAGIQLLFSYIELHSQTSYSMASLLLRIDDIREEGGSQYNNNVHRRKEFDEKFDRVEKALREGKDYKERLSILFNGRKHQKQIEIVEKQRKLWQKS